MSNLPYEKEKEDLAELGTNGIASTVAGAGILIGSSILTNIPVVGVLAGIIIAFGGYSINKKSTSKSDKFIGSLITAAGVLVGIASLPIPILAPISSFVLTASGLVLLGNAGYNLIKFFKRIKKRKK